MEKISINYEKTFDFISKDSIFSYKEAIESHKVALFNKTGKGNDFLGWTTLPSSITETELTDYEATAAKLVAKNIDIFVVIGIGGSYLGAKAVVDALSDSFAHLKERKSPFILFAGQNISEDYLFELRELLKTKEYAMAVISKSGTTTEPAIAFRFLKAYVERRYGKEGARERIVAITDRVRGALKGLADEEGYSRFVIPDDVGGRYSVLTPVGLLPVAVAGWDTTQLIEGARTMAVALRDAPTLADHPAGWYASARSALYRRGKAVEVMVNYEPCLSYFSEWWKQLNGESEGKQQRGIFPASVSFTTDLHSMGQYIQDGLRILFETVLLVDEARTELKVPHDEANADGLNFIAGMRLEDINAKAAQGTLLAHVDGGVPNIRISIPRISEHSLGELIYFYEMGCALSGYMLGVNPFDQPGVEEYKRNMFALLDKPGFEKQKEELERRLRME